MRVLLYGQMTDAALVDVFVFNFGVGRREAAYRRGRIHAQGEQSNRAVSGPGAQQHRRGYERHLSGRPGRNIYEINAFIMARWSNFPWSKTIRTTFGLGGGLSYASDIPSIEIHPNKPDGDYKQASALHCGRSHIRASRAPGLADRLPPAPSLRRLRPHGGRERGKHRGADRPASLFQIDPRARHERRAARLVRGSPGTVILRSLAIIGEGQ